MIGLPFFYSCAAEIQIHFSTVTLAENVQNMKPVQKLHRFHILQISRGSFSIH